MTLFAPLPRSVTRPVSVLIVIAWVASTGVLIKRSYFDASTINLATDLARYGSNAEWRGVYYRGEKIGFTVSQTVPTDDGFELQEDGRLQMSLLGATTRGGDAYRGARRHRTSRLRSFDFSLDPGTGADYRSRPRRHAMPNGGARRGWSLRITSGGSTRTESATSPRRPCPLAEFFHGCSRTAA